VSPAQLGPPLTEQAEDIDRVWDVFLVAAFVVGVGVIALIVYVLVRFRRRSTTLPRQRRELIPLEVTYTLIPLLVVAGLFALTFITVEVIDAEEEPDLTIEVIGFQWQWQFDYPASGVSVVGTDTEQPELVLPAGARVQFDLTSVDVIHSFWIPGFRFKRDVFPGQTQTFQVDVGGTTGDFPNTGVCAEFCGLDHSTMRFSVRVVTPDEFAAWAQDTQYQTEEAGS
jgi:cytochrome c oxidase subunit 2